MNILGLLGFSCCNQESPEQKRVREMHEFHQANFARLAHEAAKEGKMITSYAREALAQWNKYRGDLK